MRPRSGHNDVKALFRLRRDVNELLGERAAAAGLSRGQYLATVIDGAPAPPLPRDHSACLVALGLSTDQLAVVARDLASLSRSSADPAALIALGRDVHDHLALASELLCDLRMEAVERGRVLRATRRAPST